MAFGDRFKQQISLMTSITSNKSAWEKTKKEFRIKLSKAIGNTLRLKSLVNSVFATFSNSNIIVLFSRMDFKGMGNYPQMFIIIPCGEPVTTSVISNTTDKPVINMQTRKAEYASYNIVTQPVELHFNKAFLTGADGKMIKLIKNADRILPKSQFSFSFHSLLQNDVNIIRHNFNERIASGCYFTLYSPSVGFHESAVVTNLTTTNTVLYGRIQISIGIKIVKTFNIDNYKDFDYLDFYKA